MTQPKFSPGQWDYIGDECVGVVSSCECPPVPITVQHTVPGDPESYISFAGDREHESHDLVEPIFEGDLPVGVTWEEWKANCKLWAAAKELFQIVQTFEQRLLISMAGHESCCPCSDCQTLLQVQVAIHKTEYGRLPGKVS